ncbi:MAG: glycosyltransferase family 4 protein [Patescibacteria group bacterium]|nr:MAG: glycosyltransferase family 4 protein [Patescibacteria group bacterium]
MRVAVVVSTFPPYPGGMGNVAAAHAEALSRAGHAVTVLAPGQGLRPLFRFGNAACVPQLWWKLRGFDAVELHYPFFGGAEWVWFWKKTFGRRTRLSILYHMDTVGRGWLAWIFRFYRALFLEAILGAADIVMVTSRDYLASSQIAFLQNDARLRETPLGVDVERFKPGGEKKNALLFVGGLDRAHYFKGIPVLLEAFAKIAAALPSVELWIVGDGDLRASYETLAAKTGFGGHMRFFGRVTDEKLAELYRQARVHVLPSVDRSEAFGLVTLAAAASGIPSVVSDLPGVRSVLEKGKTGLVVPPSDAGALAAALRELLSYPERAAAMGASARTRALETYASSITDRLVVEAVCG